MLKHLSWDLLALNLRRWPGRRHLHLSEANVLQTAIDRNSHEFKVNNEHINNILYS